MFKKIFILSSYKNRNRDLQIKKEDEEMVNHMMQWSKNKSRLEKEIHRRIDSRK